MMALPLLDAMLPLSALAQSARKVRPNRMAFISVPNGIHMPAWTPATDGPDFALPSILEPLQKVRGSIISMDVGDLHRALNELEAESVAFVVYHA